MLFGQFRDSADRKKHFLRCTRIQMRDSSHKALALCRSFIDFDRPLQRSTSGILILSLFDSQTTLQLQQLSSKILPENYFTKDQKKKLKLSKLKNHSTKRNNEIHKKIVIVGGKRHDNFDDAIGCLSNPNHLQDGHLM